MFQKNHFQVTLSPMKRNESVIGIVFDSRKEHVLLIHRRDVAIWALPGGGIDDGEQPEQSVLREVEEETTLKAHIVRKLALLTPINRLTRTTHLFICQAEGEPQATEETRDARFFSLTSLPSPLFHIHEAWIRMALINSEGLIERSLTEVTYWKLFKYFIKHPLQVIRTLLSRFGFPINK